MTVGELKRVIAESGLSDDDLVYSDDFLNEVVTARMVPAHIGNGIGIGFKSVEESESKLREYRERYPHSDLKAVKLLLVQSEDHADDDYEDEDEEDNEE